MSRNVLITGASIAGPALAYWLTRAGMTVTVIERAQSFRDTGQNVDVRGLGREVIRRMALKEQVKAKTTGERAIAFVDAGNRVCARIDVGDFGSDGPTAELEILRGDLARLLLEATERNVRYIFGDRICALVESSGGVDVTFEHAAPQRFDLVIAAEGIGSSTRRLVFGDEARRVPLDLYMGYFSIPRGPGDGAIARWFNPPGARSVFLRPGGVCTHVILTVRQPPDGQEDKTTDQQKAWLAARFADAGWEIARILDGLASAEDFYFEAIGQVKMPRWTKGRVALVGDAGYCASPISGMGTSLALVGAYVLAGELARQADHEAAFAAYERIMRPYVKDAQDVPRLGPRIAQPTTKLGIALQRRAIALVSGQPFRQIAKSLMSSKKDAITLPDYETGTTLTQKDR
jgi:2-polyprenyl-6-methoxyphenol hydroxylase-like FAD-dependent oxidoreductase